MLTNYSDFEKVRGAMPGKAVDYLLKIDLNEGIQKAQAHDPHRMADPKTAGDTAAGPGEPGGVKFPLTGKIFLRYNNHRTLL